MRKVSSIEAMELAIEEGKKGWGNVAPNPLVGCSIVSSKGELLSVGYHRQFGGPHAEVVALNNVKDPESLIGAHVFVTLEPCAHQGKTGSCATALVDAKVGSVTYGVEDPNPLVAGLGLKRLQEAGILVQETTPELAKKCRDLAEMFLHGQTSKYPFVALKIASSLDGVIALKSGESRWITSERSRIRVHYLRAQFDALLVGRKTVVEDDPLLNIRHPDFGERSNRVVIIDPELKLLENIEKKRLFSSRNPKDVIFISAATKEVSDLKGCTNIAVPESQNGLDLDSAMLALRKVGIESLFVEGGAYTLGAFFRKPYLVNKLYLFVSGSILGMGNGVSWSEHFEIARLDKKIVLDNISCEGLDKDLLVTAKIQGK
ncbi:MAG: bifunctional diaminohydroxyphosphoribosylaminopyrimidine deaminase/5-amino-6-(5-phosphoribosylamino)uracil reductase RibD [Bdellovibrionales bacterium]|nr:bifunctional diaminohydroxyphosphoribosylaminopyrimidine deaminase/5-amino-6-(5-phosphoribosylamino)uracil reductase RibD [Bdellovibrionales bacterium]